MTPIDPCTELLDAQNYEATTSAWEWREPRMANGVKHPEWWEVLHLRLRRSTGVL